MKQKINTIDVTAFEDKTGSYFSARVTVNWGTPEARECGIPFQFGMNDTYRNVAFEKLIEKREIEPTKEPIWKYCRANGIILRCVRHENKKMKDVKSFGSITDPY